MKNLNNITINNNTQLIGSFDTSNFSKDNITFLTEQVTNKKLFKIGYYHFFKIPQLELGILRDFFQLLDFNKAYIVLPILATQEFTGEGPILSLSRQILVTRDSNPITIINFLFKQIEVACMNYGINDLVNYTVVFKFRPITLNDEIVKEIPKIQYNGQEKSIKTKKLISMLNYKFLNGSILPLSMNINLYGDRLNKFLSSYYILKFDLDPNGILFKKDDFVIYINKLTDSKHEGILFKDKAIYYRFEDVLIEGNKLIRFMDKFVIYIDNFNISYFDRLLNSTFISPIKPNLKLNKKIITFDIETYVKDGNFIAFSCG